MAEGRRSHRTGSVEIRGRFFVGVIAHADPYPRWSSRPRCALVREGVQIMDESVAVRQDIRPMQIGLLNLMPNKIATETQIARLIGSSPLQVELTLVRIGSHVAKNTSEDHLINFYHTWDEVKHRKFDGFIITGAPIETLPFEDVTYWDEMTQILDWTTTHVHSSFFVCWGAMAAAWHFHKRAEIRALQEKAFGVYRHRNLNPASPYLTGFRTISRFRCRAGPRCAARTSRRISRS
jgi:homoserine O-succinyltransferase